MNIVLVHGGWHGGWCWKHIAARLRASSHSVFAPTMTGLGERSHLIAQVDGPETHVVDICNVIRWNELDEVMLVGHSYGGMIITGAASQMPDRIASLVYLDAFVPTENNQAASSMANPERVAEIKASIQEDGTILPNGFERWSADPGTIAWLKTMCTPHPAACFGKGVTLTGQQNSIGSRTFILAGQHDPSPFQQFYQLYKNDPAWNVHVMDCLHDVMLEKPEELSDLLNHCAIQSKTGITAHE